jgi:hypothetical protein
MGAFAPPENHLCVSVAIGGGGVGERGMLLFRIEWYSTGNFL